MPVYRLFSLLTMYWIIVGILHILHGAEFPEKQLSSKITTEEYRNYLEQNLFTDLYHSYDNKMGEAGNNFTQLFRTNIPGDYHYEVTREEKEQAVLFLSYLDALSFCSYQEGMQLFLSLEELVLTLITIRLLHLDLWQKSGTFINTMLQARTLLPHQNSSPTSLNGHDVYKISRSTGCLLQEAGGIDPELKSNLFLFHLAKDAISEAPKNQKTSQEIASWDDYILSISILIASSVLCSQDHHTFHQEQYSCLQKKNEHYSIKELHSLDFSCLFNHPYALENLHCQIKGIIHPGIEYFPSMKQQTQETIVYMHHHAIIINEHEQKCNQAGSNIPVNSSQNKSLKHYASNFSHFADYQRNVSSLNQKKDSPNGIISYQNQQSISNKRLKPSLEFSGCLSSDSEADQKETFSLSLRNNPNPFVENQGSLKHQVPINTPPTKEEKQKILTQSPTSYGTFPDQKLEK